MKILPAITVACSLCVAISAFAQSAQELSSEAQRAYIKGDIETAKQKFALVLKMEPENKIAQNYMRMIQTQELKNGTGSPLEKQLKTLILPKLDLRQATFDSALEYMKQQAAKQSVTVSIVVQPEVNQSQTVTLNLANMPFTEALKYLCDLGNAKYSIEKFAVVVKAKSPEAAQEPGPASK